MMVRTDANQKLILEQVDVVKLEEAPPGGGGGGGGEKAIIFPVPPW